MELFKIDKTDEDFIERKYRPQNGFLVYWDYILNLAKEYKQVQLVYGIYHKGMTLFEPRLVPLTDTIDTTHPAFCQALFNINHLVRDVEAHPDVLLVLEVQVPANRLTNQTKKSNISTSKAHTGYLLSKQGKVLPDGTYVYGDEDKEVREEPLDEAPETNVFQTYAWSVLNLFNFKNDLKRGTYKLPLYKPPTVINIDIRDIP